MPRIDQEESIFNFTKGKITEATPFTFPENAALDLNNVILERDGTVSRRKGLGKEPNANEFQDNSVTDKAQNSFLWKNVNNDPDVNFIVLQNGNDILFYDADKDSYSDNKKGEVNISTEGLTVSGLSDNVRTFFTSGNGDLYGVNKHSRPFRVRYFPVSDVFSVKEIKVEVRDTEGVDENLSLTKRPDFPVFDNGNQTISVSNGGEEDINSELAVTDRNTDEEITWTVDLAPSEGDIIGLPTTEDAGVSVTPSGVKYDHTGANDTTDKFTITAKDSVGYTNTITIGVSIGSGTASVSSGSQTKISDAHRYNLQNQGWPDNSDFQVFDDQSGSSTSLKNPADYFNSKFNKYPANSDIFTLGIRKEATAEEVKNAFSPWQLKEQVQEIEAIPPKGHYILDFFDKVRSAKPNVSDTSLDDKIYQNGERGPEAVTFFTDRLWLAYKETLFFSQLIDNLKEDSNGKLIPGFYQRQDPTSQSFNSLLLTDGGTIRIPGAGNITYLSNIGNSVIVFSDSGVWQIAGTEEFGFTPTNFSVSKITNEGVISAASIIEVGNTLYYWSDNGIYRIAPDEETKRLGVENITFNTIQSDYDKIDPIDKGTVKGEWIRQEGKIYWQFDLLFSSLSFNVLVFNIFSGAFYTFNTESAKGDVIATVPDTKFKFFVYYIDPDNGDLQLTFAEFNNSDFRDWAFESEGDSYDSFIETRYILPGSDVIRSKKATYIFPFFNITETGYKEDNNGNLVFDNPSGCNLKVFWDFTKDGKAGKLVDLGNVYRLQRYYLPGGKNDPFDFSYTITTSKHKVRGSGKALNLKFESKDGEDFQLLGFNVTTTVRSKP